ncbi:MAG: hypothetical protein HY942_00290 [Gammaproteobacteria bacterium]|nr:hypothetical protein [Gammaproteobacteria bacterium]
MKRLIGLIALLAVSACQTAPLPREESPYYTVPVGSRVTLHKELTIPAARASVYIQGTLIATWQEVNSYHPHCIFEVYKVKDTPQRVQPGTFTVRKVRQQHLSGIRPGTRYARLFADSDPSFVIYATVMDLESIEQPEVFRLTCQHWEIPSQSQQHLTIRQIRTALGELITLKLPDTN